MTAYFDDSGTHAGSPVILMGGLIGDDDQWREFEPAWQATLAAPTEGRGPIKRFHAYDLQHGLNEFDGWKDGDIDNTFFNFRKVILDCELRGYVIAIEVAAWDDLIVGPMRTFMGDAERYCVAQAILMSAALCHQADPDRSIAFVFDNRPERNTVNERIFRIFQRFHVLESELPAIRDVAFFGSMDCLPLQGADLVAYEYFLFVSAIHKAGGVPVPARAHWRRLTESGRMEGQMALREHIQKIADHTEITPEQADLGRLLLGL